MKTDTIDLATLIEAGIVRFDTKDVKIIAAGKLTRVVTIGGIAVSLAPKAIEAAKELSIKMAIGKRY